jgi:hypothetical protein
MVSWGRNESDFVAIPALSAHLLLDRGRRHSVPDFCSPPANREDELLRENENGIDDSRLQPARAEIGPG